MARTNQAAVISILLKDYDSEEQPSLTPFINTANVVTSQIASQATEDGEPLDSTTLATIEMWLAAHFYCCSDLTYTSRSTGGASGSFMGTSGDSYKGTRYGQMAMAIDPTGFLAANNPQQRASMFWGGKPHSDQIPYNDRN